MVSTVIHRAIQRPAPWCLLTYQTVCCAGSSRRPYRAYGPPSFVGGPGLPLVSQSIRYCLVPRHSGFDRSAPVLDAHGFVAPPRNTSSIPSSSRLALRAESSVDTNQNLCGEVLAKPDRARRRDVLDLVGCASGT